MVLTGTRASSPLHLQNYYSAFNPHLQLYIPSFLFVVSLLQRRRTLEPDTWIEHKEQANTRVHCRLPFTSSSTSWFQNNNCNMSDRDRIISSSECIADEASMMTPIATPSPPPSNLQSSPIANFTDPSDQELERDPIELRNVCRPKPPASRCLEKEFSVNRGLYFQDIAEAQAPMDRAQWRAPAYDDTIPKTNEEAQIVVKKFVEAMKDMSIAKDTLGSAYRKRMTPGGSMSYEDWAIEACAWGILVSGSSRDIGINMLTITSSEGSYPFTPKASRHRFMTRPLLITLARPRNGPFGIASTGSVLC